MTARSSPEGAWAAGPRFGPYRVVREVARGGMGVVYEAVHEATGVRYALKTLPPELLHAASADDVERLRREAEGMARVRHPHVARVHAAEFAGSFPYLVQAYLPGGSLAERLEREGPLPPDQAVETVRALGDGLARCHRVGVLHRDLKPQNVLYDENDRPCLTDFGLARLRGAERLTTSGTLMGTPSYMAPEQARGEGVDERADVYGLGALLYACLAGRPPFSGPSVIGLLQAVLTTPPPPPSRFVPEVPPWLDAVVLRALAKDPQERFASVREFVSALERGAPLRPRPRRALAGALAGGLVVAGLALVGLAFAWSAGAPARPQEGSPPRGAGAAGETPAGSAQATEPAPFRSSRHGLPLALELLAWRRAHPAGRVDPTVETRLALASHPLWSLDLRATAFSRARLIDDAAGPLLLYNDEPRSRVFAVALRSFSGKDPLRSLSTGGMLAWALEYDPARRWVVLAGSCPDPADPRHGAGWAGCFALESNRAVVKRTLLKAELRAIATLAPGRYVLGGTSLLALWEPPTPPETLESEGAEAMALVPLGADRFLVARSEGPGIGDRNALHVWEATPSGGWTRRSPVAPLREKPFSLAVGPRGGRVAVGTGLGNVELRSARDPAKVLRRLVSPHLPPGLRGAHGGRVVGLAFGRRGRILYSCAGSRRGSGAGRPGNSEVCAWDAASGELLARHVFSGTETFFAQGMQLFGPHDELILVDLTRPPNAAPGDPARDGRRLELWWREALLPELRAR